MLWPLISVCRKAVFRRGGSQVHQHVGEAPGWGISTEQFPRGPGPQTWGGPEFVGPLLRVAPSVTKGREPFGTETGLHGPHSAGRLEGSGAAGWVRGRPLGTPAPHLSVLSSLTGNIAGKPVGPLTTPVALCVPFKC